jgi:hypothetical protein
MQVSESQADFPGGFQDVISAEFRHFVAACHPERFFSWRLRAYPIVVTEGTQRCCYWNY